MAPSSGNDRVDLLPVQGVADRLPHSFVVQRFLRMVQEQRLHKIHIPFQHVIDPIHGSCLLVGHIRININGTACISATAVLAFATTLNVTSSR